MSCTTKVYYYLLHCSKSDIIESMIQDITAVGLHFGFNGVISSSSARVYFGSSVL